jgi:hypothetical protein
VAELFLVIAVFALPVLAGAGAVAIGRPWWWGALASVVVVLVAAIAPEPEEGESRLVAGDLIFLLFVALIATGLAWLGGRIASRLARRPA